jgi:hypothetical protein
MASVDPFFPFLQGHQHRDEMFPRHQEQHQATLPTGGRRRVSAKLHPAASRTDPPHRPGTVFTVVANQRVLREWCQQRRRIGHRLVVSLETAPWMDVADSHHHRLVDRRLAVYQLRRRWTFEVQRIECVVFIVVAVAVVDRPLQAAVAIRPAAEAVVCLSGLLPSPDGVDRMSAAATAASRDDGDDDDGGSADDDPSVEHCIATGSFHSAL